MFDFLNHTFMVYALLLGLALGVAAALISPFLVLNRQSMIADGLSHVAFSGVIFGLLLFNQPLYFAIPFAIIAVIAITYLGQLQTIEFDSAIGVISVFALAIGLITISLSDGFNRSIESLLVGSILSVTLFEVIFSLILVALTLGFILMFYRPLLSITYDPVFAEFSGAKIDVLRYGLAILTAIFVVVGVRSVGMLLISAFIIFPSLVASQLSKSFKNTLIIGVIIAIFTVFLGITISYHFDIPTGSTIAVIYTFELILFLTIRKFIRRT